MPTKKTQTIALYFSVIIMAVASIFWVNGLILAWTAPTAVPPGSNVSAPLNVGSTGQSKAGGLILNTGGAATGLIVDQGNVGIGTAGPTSKLSITGSADAPSLTAASGLFRLDGTGITGLSMGIQSASPYGTYLQSTNQPATGGGAFPLLLNPLGGNVGIGTAEPKSALEVKGTFATEANAIKGSIPVKNVTRRQNLVSFTHPLYPSYPPIYPPGQEWAKRYYHIRTPDTGGCAEMYRYDVNGYSYGIGRPLSFTWVGYLYSEAPGDIILNFAADNAGNSIPVDQYIGSDSHLYLRFGPIRQYYNSFVLDYQSGSTGEIMNHEPSGYEVFVIDGAGNL